jgi:hypothetical protein
LCFVSRTASGFLDVGSDLIKTNSFGGGGEIYQGTISKNLENSL